MIKQCLRIEVICNQTFTQIHGKTCLTFNSENYYRSERRKLDPTIIIHSELKAFFH